MIITEYQFLQYKDENKKSNYIDQKTFEELERFILENEETAQYLKITTKKGFGKVLQAQNYVGVIQTKNGTTIEILPKIANLNDDKKGKKSKTILIKMLKTLKKSPFKDFNMAHLKSTKMPLLEIFISMFLEVLANLIRKGIKSDYITREENLKFLKGKLKINEHIKQNYIHRERFFVEYQEFQVNRVENKLIKTTLQFLYKKSKSSANQQRIREFLFVFDEVGLSQDFKTDFSKIKLNRQMKDYELVLLWSRTFLLENSFTPHKGKDVAFALLFDMNVLFESYVGHYFKKMGLDVKLQDKTHHLVYLNDSKKFLLKPDFVINKNKENEIIADTKWKILSEHKSHQGVSTNDMYQLFAYGKKYKQGQNKNMYLIYPKHDKTFSLQESHYQFNRPGSISLDLKILFFDLQNDENPIEEFWKN